MTLDELFKDIEDKYAPDPGYAEDELYGCSSTTIRLSPPCPHADGWYGAVDFWVFRREIFSCSVCGEILYGKKLRDFRKKRQGGRR